MTDADLENLTQSFLDLGMSGIESYLDELPPIKDQRLVILNSLRNAVANVYINNKQLDRMQEIYEECITEALAIADGDEELIAYANITSYNLSANLADCWLDAAEPRSEKHYLAGIEAAKRCLELRVLLNKPPAAMAMAYFTLGVHEYSLRNYSNAEQAWQSKLENELQWQETQAQEGYDLNIILSHGLIGLANWSLGAEDNKEYENSLRRLEEKRTAENFNEIDLYVNELLLLNQKHGPGSG